MRGTSRTAERLGAIELAGADGVRADPDVVATLVPAFEHVTVVCILLGSAAGSDEQLRALHGTRLEMLLTKLVDTTVRGVVYEARGTVDEEILVRGAERVRAYAERSLAGYALIERDPAPVEPWLDAAVAGYSTVLGPVVPATPE